METRQRWFVIILSILVICILIFIIGWFLRKWKVVEIRPLEAFAAEVRAPNVDIWKGYAKLKRICSCESAFGSPNNEPRQFDDGGNLIRGNPNPNDIGACQISTHYHLEEAKKLGYDIFSYAGNIGFAKWLFDKQGDIPWKWSKGCWDRAVYN